MAARLDNVGGENSGGVARLRCWMVRWTRRLDVGVALQPEYRDRRPGVAIDVQPNGQILIAGALTAYDLLPYYGILRLNTDGTADTSFAPGTGTYNSYTGLGDTVYAITLQPDGNILIGGNCRGSTRPAAWGWPGLPFQAGVDTSFMDTAYNEFAGIPNEYFNENAVNPALYPVTNARNLVHAIGLDSWGTSSLAAVSSVLAAVTRGTRCVTAAMSPG